MLFSKLLGIKNTIKDSDNQSYTDLIYNTFKFPRESFGIGVVRVNEEESMRPDLISKRVLGDQNLWDVFLKYNGVSNPFSLETDDIMYAIPANDISNLYVQPREIAERGEKSETDFSAILDPNANKDRNRLSNLSNKQQLPPNINSTGDSNVKVKDGKLVFGEDVTTVNKNNCPTPISRSRLQAALLKDKLFI